MSSSARTTGSSVRELLEEQPHGAVAAIPLLLDRDPTPADWCRKRWKDGGELGSDVLAKHVESSWVERLEKLVQRVHEDREGQILLELRRAARHHGVPTRVCPCSELGEETGLANARLAHQLQCRRCAAVEVVEEAIEGGELLGAPDEVVGKSHSLLRAQP